MKTVSKRVQKDNRVTQTVIRRLFELQIQLERINDQAHPYYQEFQKVIESLDDLFEKMMDS